MLLPGNSSPQTYGIQSRTKRSTVSSTSFVPDVTVKHSDLYGMQRLDSTICTGSTRPSTTRLVVSERKRNAP
eukprot:165019-Rhodomonas_salina.1